MKAETGHLIKKWGKFWVYWFPVAAYMSLIFFLSSRSTLPVNISRIPYGDKLCHCTEFALLGYHLLRAFFHEESSWLSRHALLLAIGIAVLFGLSDEFHQIFIPLRQADVSDLIADFLGAMIGVWVAFGIHRRIDQRQRKGSD